MNNGIVYVKWYEELKFVIVFIDEWKLNEFIGFVVSVSISSRKVRSDKKLLIGGMNLFMINNKFSEVSSVDLKVLFIGLLKDENYK